MASKLVWTLRSLIDLAFYMFVVFFFLQLAFECNEPPNSPWGDPFFGRKLCKTHEQFDYRAGWIAMFVLHTLFNLLVTPFVTGKPAALGKLHLLGMLIFDPHSHTEIMQGALEGRYQPNSTVAGVNLFFGTGPMILMCLTHKNAFRVFPDNAYQISKYTGTACVIAGLQLISCIFAIRQANQPRNSRVNMNALLTHTTQPRVAVVVNPQPQVAVTVNPYSANTNTHTHTPYPPAVTAHIHNNPYHVPAHTQNPYNINAPNPYAQATMQQQQYGQDKGRASVYNPVFANTNTHTHTHQPEPMPEPTAPPAYNPNA